MYPNCDCAVTISIHMMIVLPSCRPHDLSLAGIALLFGRRIVFLVSLFLSIDPPLPVNMRLIHPFVIAVVGMSLSFSCLFSRSIRSHSGLSLLPRVCSVSQVHIVRDMWQTQNGAPAIAMHETMEEKLLKYSELYGMEVGCVWAIPIDVGWDPWAPIVGQGSECTDIGPSPLRHVIGFALCTALLQYLYSVFGLRARRFSARISNTSGGARIARNFLVQ